MGILKLQQKNLLMALELAMNTLLNAGFGVFGVYLLVIGFVGLDETEQQTHFVTMSVATLASLAYFLYIVLQPRKFTLARGRGDLLLELKGALLVRVVLTFFILLMFYDDTSQENAKVKHLVVTLFIIMLLYPAIRLTALFKKK